MKKSRLSISLIAIFALLSMNTAFAADFSDVHDKTLYREGIWFLAGEGIVNGNPDGTFAPDATINRAAMLKILVEAVVDASTLDGSKSCFNDVEANIWYTKYVCYAKEAGWVEGYENGTLFKPAQDVQFVEGLKMALKAFEINYDETTEVWYEGAVNAASMMNYIPFDVSSFAKSLNRGQMADMVARILKDQTDELEDYLLMRFDWEPTYESIAQGRNMADEYWADDSDVSDNSSYGQVYTIERNSSGFSPSTLTINKGDVVKFLNRSGSDIWPASNAHPNHEEYPGTRSSLCGYGYNLFDACEAVPNDKEFEFTFMEIGTWGYHDHLNPSIKGTITVQ